MTERNAPPKRWDPVVKITHWGIAAAIAANAFFTEEGSGWHVWVGYGLGGLLGLRLLWALAGPANARFTAFPPSPMRAIRYLKEQFSGIHVEHASHNPLGALMVYALWACLAIIIASGVAMSGPPPANPNTDRNETEASRSILSGNIDFTASDRAEAESDDDKEEEAEVMPTAIYGENEGESEGAEWLEEVHEAAVNLLYLLVVLHILGVAVETARHGRGTVKAMLPFPSRRTR